MVVVGGAVPVCVSVLRVCLSVFVSVLYFWTIILKHIYMNEIKKKFPLSKKKREERERERDFRAFFIFYTTPTPHHLPTSYLPMRHRPTYQYLSILSKTHTPPVYRPVYVIGRYRTPQNSKSFFKGS